MKSSILAIETCSEICSVALFYKGSQLQNISTEPRGHADSILPMIHQLLKKADVSLKQLDAIAFTRGPGAFTGVRIGTSVAQGLSVATDLPLIAVSSLAVLAQGSYRETGNDHCLAALDARMSEVYFGLYSLNDDGLMAATQADQVATACKLQCFSEQKQIQDRILWQAAGPGWHNYSLSMQQRFKNWQLEWPKQLSYPLAKDLLTHAEVHYIAGKLLDPADALPVYIRDKVVRNTI